VTQVIKMVDNKNNGFLDTHCATWGQLIYLPNYVLLKLILKLVCLS
jgi:hypothetical protein